MLYLYFMLAAIFIFGGIIAYSLGSAMQQLNAAVIAVTPSLATDAGMVFVGSIWYWMVLIVLIGAIIYIIVNSQKEPYL